MLETWTPGQRVRLNPIDNSKGTKVFKQRGDRFQWFLFKSTRVLLTD